MIIFMTGGTGYLGQNLIPQLIAHGHQVRALARPGSEENLPPGCIAVSGNALEANSFQNQITPATTFIQLVGVPHPSPLKAEQFRRVDGVSIRESVRAAKQAGIQQFIYVSVASPAPIMKVYQEVRRGGEKLIHDSGMNATIFRPWYILGPGHYWPMILSPVYTLCEQIPGLREGAQRLGYVSLKQMIKSLVTAVEQPTQGIRIWEVPEIRTRGAE